jgi:hypothetical protein
MAKRKGKKGKTVIVLVWLFLAGSAATYFMPALRLNVPGIGQISWSAWDLTESAAKAAQAEIKDQKPPQKDWDFMDLLKKITPKNPESQKPKKISGPFILGALVPVSLALSYLIVLLMSVMAAAGKTGGAVSFAGVISSGYALFGTFYLGQAAQQAFQDSMDKAAGGFLGVVTKNFVKEMTVNPGTALYFLFGFCLLIFAVHSLTKR